MLKSSYNEGELTSDSVNDCNKEEPVVSSSVRGIK